MADDRGPNRTAIYLGAGVVVLVAGAGLVLLLSGSTEAHVTGQVTLDSQPVPGAQVVFLGEAADNQAPLVTLADDQGNYRLVGNHGAGIPVGKYRVIVDKMALADGTIPQGELLVQARARGLLRNVLPKAYEDRATTPLQFDIQAGGRTVHLELKKQVPARGTGP